MTPKAPSAALLAMPLCLLWMACPPAAPPCGPDVPCPGGQHCTATGACETDTCEACGAAQTCVGAACLPRACTLALVDGGTREVTCIEGTGCVDGACLTEGCPRDCADGQACAYGACRDRSCFSGIGCPVGLLCQAGACVTEACANTPCGPGELCVGGRCEPEGCAGVACLAGEVCRDGACVSAACTGIPCPDGQRCGNGQCWPVDCAGIRCGDGLVCEAGVCVTASCAGVTCPTGTACANGACYPMACQTVSCATGSVCAGGACVDPRCAGVQCGFGERCVQGLCKGDRDADGVPDEADNCPDLPNVDQLNADSDPAGAACDCADGDSSRHPGAAELCDRVDQDCDGAPDDGLPQVSVYADGDRDTYGADATVQQACGAFDTQVLRGGDCNDARGDIFPGAAEACDGVDNNCDAVVDDQVPTWFLDVDLDGHGVPGSTVVQCNRPVGYAPIADDCDDARASVYPGANEVCDTFDNDCDTLIDEAVQSTYYRDADGDGFGNVALSVQACSAPAGYVANNTDCNDGDPALNPNTVWYRDADGDTYGTSANTLTQCGQPAGYVRRAGDCNDAAAAIHPGVTDVCDGVNNDCDGATDEDPNRSWYPDADVDGFGQSGAQPTAACNDPDGDPTLPPAYVQNATDCNDGNAAIHPGVADGCGDGVDMDCNGNDGVTEVCDGQDNDCDATVDEVTTARSTSLRQPFLVTVSSGVNGVCDPTGLLAAVSNPAYLYQGGVAATVTAQGGTTYSVSSCVRANVNAYAAWLTALTVDLEAARTNYNATCTGDGASGGAQTALVFTVSPAEELVFEGQYALAGCTTNQTCNATAATRTFPLNAYAKAVVLCRSGTAAANNLMAENLVVTNTCTRAAP